MVPSAMHKDAAIKWWISNHVTNALNINIMRRQNIIIDVIRYVVLLKPKKLVVKTYGNVFIFAYPNPLPPRNPPTNCKPIIEITENRILLFEPSLRKTHVDKTNKIATTPEISQRMLLKEAVSEKNGIRSMI